MYKGHVCHELELICDVYMCRVRPVRRQSYDNSNVDLPGPAACDERVYACACEAGGGGRAREEWFAGVEERRRVRDEESRMVGKRREEVIRMMREDEERNRNKSTG